MTQEEQIHSVADVARIATDLMREVDHDIWVAWPCCSRMEVGSLVFTESITLREGAYEMNISRDFVACRPSTHKYLVLMTIPLALPHAALRDANTSSRLVGVRSSRASLPFLKTRVTRAPSGH